MTIRRSPEETGRLGDAIYERDIRPKIGETHDGEFVAIDVDSGDYVIASASRSAAKRLRERRPSADIWSLRIGYGALRHFGGSSRRRVE